MEAVALNVKNFDSLILIKEYDELVQFNIVLEFANFTFVAFVKFEPGTKVNELGIVILTWVIFVAEPVSVLLILIV